MLYNFIQGSRILVIVLNEMVCKHLLLIPEVLSNGLNLLIMWPQVCWPQADHKICNVEHGTNEFQLAIITYPKITLSPELKYRLLLYINIIVKKIWESVVWGHEMGLVKIHSTKVEHCRAWVNKLLITRSFFSNRGVKPTVREAMQNSIHLKGRLGSIVKKNQYLNSHAHTQHEASKSNSTITLHLTYELININSFIPGKSCFILIGQ